MKNNALATTSSDEHLFLTLGFRWDRSTIPVVVPVHTVERAAFRFYRMLPEFVWDASVLEGNPFTFPEVKTILDGVTVGGKKLSDQEQVLNLAAGTKYLLLLVKSGEFSLSKSTFTKLRALIARNEALEWGNFRGEGKEKNVTPYVSLGEHGRYAPTSTSAGAIALNTVFENGVQALQGHLTKSFEKALAFFLFGTMHLFFFDGNSRTSRLMMNGLLMSSGIDAISIPASKAREFAKTMLRFYLTKNATETISFIVDCHPDGIFIRTSQIR